MESFTRITATACPLPTENIDTDQILPARFLKLPRDGSHGDALFRDLRFDEVGNESRQFPLNRQEWRQAKIIVAGRNFGGGSSREGAVYALYDHGIRCVIAPSFGDIFAQNSAKNGLLTATVTETESAELIAALERTPSIPITVDLETKSIVYGNWSLSFGIDDARRTRLLNGWDDIDATTSFRDQISNFKNAELQRRPWIVPVAGK